MGDEDAATEVEKVLAIIQRRVMWDRTHNGLALETKETGNSVDLDSEADKIVEGAVFFVVQYRHDLDDPRLYYGAEAPTPTATSKA